MALLDTQNTEYTGGGYLPPCAFIFMEALDVGLQSFIQKMASAQFR